MNTTRTLSVPSAERGITLIELLIVVALVSVLAVIALPSYQAYVQRANRVDAKNTLLQVAQRLEQNYTLAGRYDQTQDGASINDAMLTTWGLDQSPVGGAASYDLSFTTIASSTYVVKATPTGAQASDSCGVLSLNERNLKAANGQNPNTAGVSRAAATLECWNR